jgi:hypothetical protein
MLLSKQSFSLFRARTTRPFQPSLYHVFCKNIPRKLGDGWGRRLARRRLRLVLLGSRDGRGSVVWASSLGDVHLGSCCGRTWWLIHGAKILPRHHIFHYISICVCSPQASRACGDGRVQGRGGGKEEQGHSHGGGVPTFTGGGNGLVAADSSTPIWRHRFIPIRQQLRMHR